MIYFVTRIDIVAFHTSIRILTSASPPGTSSRGSAADHHSTSALSHPLSPCPLHLYRYPLHLLTEL